MMMMPVVVQNEGDGVVISLPINTQRLCVSKGSFSKATDFYFI